MSDIVDKQVVEMRFDNKQFEDGAKETIGTLGKLKEALKLPDTKSALEGIDKATKNISLDGIASGVEALEKRFSTLGIVGMRVIENITDGLMNKLNAAVSYVTDSIVSGGIKRAMNIENAHFQLQALLKDETKVQAVMDDAMESVDGTAYAYDEAAKAASQFAASGIEAGSEMLNALKGITGVAAMTNSSFEDISRVFTTVAGNGRLMGDQLLQLSSRGLNAASTLADYFKEVRGQTNATEASIREMVSKGQISFKDFSDAMTWAFGDSAKRANETFTGAMSNMKSALARIGAGFVSPLVEQNGALVQLFNALRIKINDVKSALVFDESRSMFSGLSEQLHITTEEMSKLGDNSYDSFNTLKDYINGVVDGTVKATDATKEYLTELTNGSRIGFRQVENYVNEGKISMTLFTEAMGDAYGESSDIIKNIFNEIDEAGTVTRDHLARLNAMGPNMYQSLTRYINGVSDGTINATYNIKNMVDEMTHGHEVAAWQVVDFVDKGLIDISLLSAAAENDYGNVRTLTKQFTDFFQNQVKAMVDVINNADVTKPMEVLYYWIETIKNVAKGALSILRPIARAFSDVYLSFTIDDVISFSEAVEKMTEKISLSEKNSNNLYDAFKGLFDVGKLLLDVVLDLLEVFIDFKRPTREFGDGLLTLIGIFGRTLSNIVQSIRSSELLNEGFDLVKRSIEFVIDSLTFLITTVKDFVDSVSELPGTQKLIEAVSDAFENFGKFATPYVESFITAISNLTDGLFNLDGVDSEGLLNKISDSFGNLADKINSIDFSKPSSLISAFIDKIKELFGIFKNDGTPSSSGLQSFVDNVKETFSFDNLFEKVDGFMSVFDKFFQWTKDTFGPAFEGFNIGSAIAGAGGIGAIYSLLNISKSLENITNPLASIGGVLTSYQKNMDADALIKTAGAIAILAGALIALSFVDSNKLIISAMALSMVASVLLFGFTALLDSINKGKELNNSLNLFITGLNKAMDNLTQAVKIKAIGVMVKDFAESILIIAASIALIAYVWRKDPEAFDEAIKVVGGIGLCLVAIGALSVLGSNLMGSGSFSNMSSISKSMIEMAASILLIVLAVDKLMKITLPTDYGIKLGILAGLFIGMAAIALVLGLAGRIAGGGSSGDISGLTGTLSQGGVSATLGKWVGRMSSSNGGSLSAAPILALAGMLYVSVMAIEKLMNIKLPYDYKIKLEIMAGLLLGMAGIAIAVGLASKLSGGNSLKAAGSILALSVFLLTVVGALYVLTILPVSKMLSGALAIGIILVALGASLYGASKIADKGVYKSILAMTFMLSAITASLALLSLIPFNKLLTSVLALGVMLLALGQTFKDIGTIKNSKDVIPVIIAMLIGVVAIAVSLAALSKQPWEGLLAAAAAMSVTLLAFSAAFKIVLKDKWSNDSLKQIGTFLLMTLAVIPIGAALFILSSQPWEGLLAAGVALSAILLTMAGCFAIISKVGQVDPANIVLFVVASIAAAGVAIGLSFLADKNVDSILAATVSLGLILAELAILMGVCSVIGAAAGPAIIGLGLMMLVVVALGALVAGIGALVNQFDGLKEALTTGVEVMNLIGQAIGGFIGGIIEGIGTGIINLIPKLGEALSQFAVALGPFMIMVKMFDGDMLLNVGFLTAAMLAMTVAEILAAIGSLLGLNLIGFGLELSGFMLALGPFIAGLNTIDGEAAEACGYLADMILKLTATSIVNGIAGIFGLSGSLADFAEQLKAFGPAISEFAETVKDVKPEAVEGAAAAATIMAEMANKLPASDGLIQKIFGEKSLAQFAEELKAFGPAIVKFAKTVEGVTPESVEGAAEAASIMAKMATGLPNMGGLVSKILGDNKLSDFGIELEAFGPHILKFAKTVSGIDEASVQGAAGVTEIMSTLANNLPNMGGVVSWFTGDNKLSDFGDELWDFGDSMAEYYDAVKDIDASKMDVVYDSFLKLANLADYMKLHESDASYLVDFSDALGDVGTYSVENFIKAFTDSTEKVNEAINNMFSTVLISINSENESIQNSVTLLINSALLSIQLRAVDFLMKGTLCASSYLDGIKIKYSDANKIGTGIGAASVNGINKKSGDFYKAGQNAGQGFINGLASMIEEAAATAREMARAAYEAIQSELDIHSPSRKMGYLGDNAGLGFINKLMLYISEASEVGEEIGTAVVKGSKIGLEKFDDLDAYTIYPTVDMSNIYSSANEIESLFNNAIDNLRTNTIVVDSEVRNAVAKSDSNQNVEGSGSNNIGATTYNFNQYNTSPKALSAIDIYRQSNNMFMQFKEARS